MVSRKRASGEGEKRKAPACRREAGYSRRRRSGLIIAVLTVFAAAAWSGCAAFQGGGGSREGPRSSVLHPRWHEDALAEHLRFFRETLRGEEAQPARIGAYLSDRMKAANLQPAVEGRYKLPALPTGTMGFVGYVAGKNPKYRQEVVIVCADLTAEAPAVSAAALLEVARAYGTFAQYELEPERSVLFALWFPSASPRTADSPSGAAAADPTGGLRAYLRRPTWSLAATRSVLYAGLPLNRRAAVEALLRDYDIPLHRIEAPPPAASRLADTTGGVPADASAAVDRENMRRDEVRRARALAQRTHERLRAETITFGKMMPALGDTLRVPHEQE